MALKSWKTSHRYVGSPRGTHACRLAAQVALVASLGAATSSVPQIAAAQMPPEAVTARFKYAYYKDFQAGNEDRMRVSTPMLWMNGPLGESGEFELSAAYDSLSGASPLFHDTLSGASEKGIEDIRRAGDVKFTKYFESFAIGVGAAHSEEDDYRSRSGVLDARYWTPDKNTVFSAGVSSDWDRITSSSNPDLDEDRTTRHYLVGVTQVINPVSIVQCNLTYANGRGYFIDPYKLFDNRPRSREEWALLTRYNYFLESMDASIHADYRLFFNTWGVTSHTVALRYFQPVSESLMVVPMFRYYTQSKADFFLNEVPPENFEQFMSADERLSSFGGVSLGMQLQYKLSDSTTFDLTYEHTAQAAGLRIGGGDDTFHRFGANYIEAGVAVKF